MKGKRGTLTGFRRRWQGGMVLECLLLALGAGALVLLAGGGPWGTMAGTLVVLGIGLMAYRPWRLDMASVVAHIDAHVLEADHSSGLLLRAPEDMPRLSRLQRHRVAARLAPKLAKLRPPHRLGLSLPLALGLFLLGVAIHSFGPWGSPLPIGPSDPGQIHFQALDSTPPPVAAPHLEGTSIRVRPPEYTGLPVQNLTDPNIRAVVGSSVTWTLDFEGAPARVWMDWMGEVHPLTGQEGTFSLHLGVERSGFYSFGFEDAQGKEYGSAMYFLEATADAPPTIELKGLDTYTQFGAREKKTLLLLPGFRDDFGLMDAYIVATVSKGSGESVKFREEILRFEDRFPKGSKIGSARRVLDLDQLGMDPGDELYFHIVALDNRWPDPQSARSETFFAQIRDSLGDPLAVEGGMGVDLMPQYFRSQRQLIIDTERLIADKPGIPRQDFNARSNELGFDQKSLRLKYGQFMGDETEVQAPPGGSVDGIAEEVHDEHGEADGDDPLDGFRHDHDSENEHNLLPEHTHREGEEGEPADPLGQYLHNHDDPEESTLFERSLKEKLRAALDIMWDAELHLRLHAPEKSLPYQYRALELLQDIKNSARIYVHRIGFDPPPIKEDRRLTGDLEGVGNFHKSGQIDYRPPFADARKAVARLELLAQGAAPLPGDGQLFHGAGKELAEKAVDSPLEYLQVLQGLRDLDREEGRSPGNYARVLRLLLSAIPPPEDNPGGKLGLGTEIDQLYLKELGHE